MAVIWPIWIAWETALISVSPSPVHRSKFTVKEERCLVRSPGEKLLGKNEVLFHNIGFAIIARWVPLADMVEWGN